MENNNHQDTTFNANESGEDKRADAYFMSLPPGYRFDPNDEELIEDYLKKKVMKRELPINRIFDVNLYNEHPDSLTGKYKLVGAREWYFFTQRARRYRKGPWPDRRAGEGYWKLNGKTVAIPERNPQGYRNSLDYYTGKHPNEKKTEWRMHEFRLHDAAVSAPFISSSDGSERDSKMLDGWVLCKVYNKREKGTTGVVDGNAKANSSHSGDTTADRQWEYGSSSFLQNENVVTINGSVEANSSHSEDTIADPRLEIENGFLLQNGVCSSSEPQQYYFHGSSSATPHTTLNNISNNHSYDGLVIDQPLNNGWGQTSGRYAGINMGNHVALDGLPSSSNPSLHFPAPEEDSWLLGLEDNSPFPENELPDELVDHYINYDVWDDDEGEQKLKADD